MSDAQSLAQRLRELADEVESLVSDDESNEVEIELEAPAKKPLKDSGKMDRAMSVMSKYMK